MREVEISVHTRGERAVVRKVVRDDEGRVAAKYGLSSAGRWLKVAEGVAYPDECLLPVRMVAWLPTWWEVKGWLYNGIWSLRARWSKRGR